MSAITDDYILKLMRNGDPDKGFRLLMDKYQEKLYWHIRRMVYEHSDADDVLQNVLIKIYRNIGQFEGKSQLFTWIFRIASNESITFINQRKRRQSRSVVMDDHTGHEKLTAESYFDEDDTVKILYKAIETLPDKQRLVFQMRYFDEMSYQEISETLETSQGALKASYHHAVKKIEVYIKSLSIRD